MHAPRILVVDDSQEKLRTMAHAAEAAHPRTIIHTAENVRDGLRHVAEVGQGIDVALFDFDLPDGTGAELTRSMRCANQSTHIALGTARTEGGSFEEASMLTLAAGADAAFTSSREDFAANIRSVVAQGSKR